MKALFHEFNQFLDRPNISKQTREKYFYRLRRFVDQHGHKLPKDITTDDMSQFIASQPQLSEASKKLIKQAFHALLNFCGVSPNPAKSLPNWSDVPRRVILPNDADVKAVMQLAERMVNSDNPVDIRDGLIFALAVVSGNRRGELRNLPLADLLAALDHPEENGIHRVYTEGKTGEAILRFAAPHVPMIGRYLDIRPQTDSPFVFVNLNQHHANYGKQLSLVAFDRVRPKLCKRAGVPTITYQELRRRIGSKIARATNPTMAAQALNHSKHSGDRVIRLFYFDPDKTAVDEQIAAVFDF